MGYLIVGHHFCSQKEFPDFMIGFDLVGQEELGRPLIDFVDSLLKMPEQIKFFFHAGETNWFGSAIDENLTDAIMLGTKRIGHGYAITKHPVSMGLARFLDIAIEVCPVSNQVLQLGVDYRNHPAALLLASNVPIVISSDDPSFWRCAPLSHDLLRLPGHCAGGSGLEVPQVPGHELTAVQCPGGRRENVAFAKWQKSWDKWIDDLVSEKGCSN